MASNEYEKRLVFSGGEEVLRAMFSAYMETGCERELAEKHKLTDEAFIKRYLLCDVVGISINGIIAGGAVFDRGNMHLAVQRKYRVKWFCLLKPLLDWAFSKYGETLVAIVNKENASARKFIEHVGCHYICKNEHSVKYLIVKEDMYYGRNCR